MIHWRKIKSNHILLCLYLSKTCHAHLPYQTADVKGKTLLLYLTNELHCLQGQKEKKPINCEIYFIILKFLEPSLQSDLVYYYLFSPLSSTVSYSKLHKTVWIFLPFPLWIAI